MDDGVGRKLSGPPGIVASRIKSTWSIPQGPMPGLRPCNVLISDLEDGMEQVCA